MAINLTVGRLARIGGVTPKTVRYYESLGLLPAVRRAENGYRLYDDESVNRLAFVQRAKSLGLSLAEIRALMDASDDGLCAVIGPELHHLVERKIRECDQRISEISAFRATLVDAADRLGALAFDASLTCPSCSAFTPDCTCLPAVALDIAAQDNV